MNITIKTIKSKFFFSGDIYLNMDKEVSLELSKLTKTQLLDIIEAQSMKTLIVSNIDAVNKQYQILSGSSGDGLSAYDLAVSKGFTGSLDDWLLQVRATIKLSQESKNIIKNTEEGLYAEVPESKNLDSFVAALNAALEN